MNSGKIVKIVLILISSIVLSVAASAQMPSLKGQTIGETVQQFLDNSSDLNSYLALCRDAKTQKLARKNGVSWDSCQILIKAVDNKGSVEVPTQCRGINLRTFQEGPPCLEFDGAVDFSDGKLVAIELNLLDPWASVYQDLVAKFGKPTTTGQDEFKNNFGAVFYGSTALWKEEAFSVTANEKVESNRYTDSGRIRKITVVLATNESLAKLAAQEGPRKSTLD